MSSVLSLNLLFVVAGAGILYAVRGWPSWSAVAKELGLVYLCGLAATGVVVTLSLVVGIPFSRTSVVLIGVAIATVGFGTGARRRSARPHWTTPRLPRPRTGADVLTWLLAALTLLLALDFLRAFRHARLTAYDAWNFWIPKAKVIYFFGGIDHEIFRQLAHPAYPLFVPTLDAMVFASAHSTDPALLGVQYGLLLLGVVGAIASLLVPLAGRGLTWLFLAFFLVLPEVEGRWFQFLADWTLASFFVVSALVLARWLRTREGWLLALAPVLLAATLVTKREGQVFVAILVVAFAAATFAERSRVWPRLLLVAAGAFVVSQLPWRIWWMSHHLPSDLTEGGIANPGSVGRLLSSARIVLELMFSYNLWLLALPLAVAAAAAALLAARESRPLVVFYGVALGLLFLAFVWAIWATPTIPLDVHDRAYDPVPREAASAAFMSLAFAAVFARSALARVPLHALSLPPLQSASALYVVARDRLVAARPSRVLAGFVVAQWVLVIGLAATIRHESWIFYQGGDQLWYYTTGWLLVHGHYPQPGVGFLWPILLAPIALVTGPNAANAFPAVIVLQVLILLPAALLLIYGIGRQIGGRLFGYWTAALWLLVPLIGIEYTDAGYHERYTETLLPQAFGLTAMADLPSTIAALASAYFCVRVLARREGSAWDSAAAGLTAGIAIAIKPSTALFLAGPALAFVVARYWRSAGYFVAGIAPSVLALAYIKWRGFGYVPLFHATGAVRLAADHAVPLAATGLSRYLHFDWHTFTAQLDQLREHFWSARLIEWLVVGGLVGVFIRSRRYGALMLGWFAAFAIVKTGSGRGTLEAGSLLRLLMPAYPAFVVMLASLVFLLPGFARRVPVAAAVVPRVSERSRLTLFVAGVLVSAVIPIAAYASTSPVRGPAPQAAIVAEAPIPLNIDLHLRARKTASGTHLTWQPQHPSGGPVFYHVFRAPPGPAAIVCGDRVGSGADYCQLQLTDLGTTASPEFAITNAPSGQWAYYVGVAANWLNDQTQGDVYELSRPVLVP